MAIPTIVVLGASNDRAKYGNKAVRAYVKRGWTVYPVNTRETTIEGLPVFRSIRDVPGPVDRVALYLPPSAGETILDDLAAAKPREVFLNPGSESTSLLAGLSERGLVFAMGCAILDIGEAPADY